MDQVAARAGDSSAPAKLPEREASDAAMIAALREALVAALEEEAACIDSEIKHIDGNLASTAASLRVLERFE